MLLYLHKDAVRIALVMAAFSQTGRMPGGEPDRQRPSAGLLRVCLMSLSATRAAHLERGEPLISTRGYGLWLCPLSGLLAAGPPTSVICFIAAAQ